jgi:hypothetical protein
MKILFSEGPVQFPKESLKLILNVSRKSGQEFYNILSKLIEVLMIRHYLLRFSTNILLLKKSL